MQTHLSKPLGNVLWFLTGQEEINTSCKILFKRMKVLGPKVPELIIFPIYSALPSEVQSYDFEPTPPGAYKVVIATRWKRVPQSQEFIMSVNPGFAKQNMYDPVCG